jgi:glycerate kinase
MKCVMAIDSFKGSLSSLEVGEAAKRGLLQALPNAEVDIVPMADGGEGTIEALLYVNKGKKIPVSVHSPIMEIVEAEYAVFEYNGIQHVFIECAQSTGLPLVPPAKRNPLNTNSYGLGEQIKDAIQKGYRHFILSLGGSATNDAGCGMLQALGWEFYNKNGEKLSHHGNPLLEVYDFSDQHVLPELKECTFIVANDVNNPFYGEKGAAYVFARQKGASDRDIEVLDQAMRRFAGLIKEHLGIEVQNIPGAGAAGGLGGGIASFLQGEMKPGVEMVMELVGLKEKIRDADLVITGEGSLDRQSSMGKVPYGVARLAKQFGIPVIGIAGRIDHDLGELNKVLDAAFSIQTECLPLEEAMKFEVASKQIEVTMNQMMRLIQAVK